MTDLSAFLNHMDWWRLFDLAISAVTALFCVTVHELSHGFAAYHLGDPTARNAGRLTLNPMAHIDPLGLLMMIVARVGWAKPVPVDVRYFKRPRRDMALTALAGPASNFLLALAALGAESLLARFVYNGGVLVGMCLASNIAILSVGLGLFNLIPIPPLDGSKVLFALLPERACQAVLRYERYSMLLVVVLTMYGVFSGPLSAAITGVLSWMCRVVGLPLEAVFRTSSISFIMKVFGY